MTAMTRWKPSVLVLAALASIGASDPPAAGDLSKLKPVGSVDARFLSFNVEMVEVTGGRFWRPYGSPGTDRYEYRRPIDLTNPKLRKFTAALAPSYLRISGTWANATWFADRDDAPDKPPPGFDTVLTHQQWRGVVDFAKATGSAIITSFATSPGARNAAGVWQTAEAARWLAYTRRIGGTIAAAEFANEPNMISLTRPPKGYTAADYRRDYATFAHWLRQASPKTLLLAPGVAELGEPTRSLSRRNKSVVQFEPDELLTSDLPKPDGFSFHFYGGASERCGGKFLGHSIDKALAPDWLDSIDAAIARMASLRDRVAPGAPLWDTETGETACGGNPWASTFADSFRFIDTLGRSARQGVRVFVHNTLNASDYGLLDEQTYDPRPNYWAALLWKRTMGTTVLAPPPTTDGLRVYAQCLPQRGGGVGIVAVNPEDAPRQLVIGGKTLTWVMQAPALDSRAATVNGRQPRLEASGKFSGLDGAPANGSVTVPARSIVFVAAPSAANASCR
jgi:hypothetical protein